MSRSDSHANAPAESRPRPHAIRDVADLVVELDHLRRRAAAGTSRKRVGLDSLAKQTGIPRSSLHAYLSGAVLPPADRLDAVLFALGVTPREARAWADSLDRLMDGALAARRSPTAATSGAGPTVLQVYACATWADTPVYAEPSPDAVQTGLLRAGNSWVLRQVRGAANPALADTTGGSGAGGGTSGPVDLWLYTQGDEGYDVRDGWGWIPAAAVAGVVAADPLPGVPWAR